MVRGRCSRLLGLAGIRNSWIDVAINESYVMPHAREPLTTSYICWITKLLIIREMPRGNSTREDTL